MNAKEALKKLGKESLANTFRKEALGHIVKFGLGPEDVEDVASTVAREIDEYRESEERAA